MRLELAGDEVWPAALVCIELLYMGWKGKSLTFPFPNGNLKKLV